MVRSSGEVSGSSPPFFSAMSLYLMSTTVIPHGADGTWTMTTVSPEQAAHIAAEGPFISAVGHSSSAEAMTAALGLTVEANRITVTPEPGDQFLCLRLLSRAPEGVILDRAGLEAIGFTWALLSYQG
jgi:hypothetical protein